MAERAQLVELKISMIGSQMTW